MSVKIQIARIIVLRNCMYLGIVPPFLAYNFGAKDIVLVISTVLSASISGFSGRSAINAVFDLEANEQDLPLRV